MKDEQLLSALKGFKDEIIEAFDQRIGIAEERFQHKLDLVVEGQQMLAERMDRMEGRLDRVETRLDRVEVRIDAVEASLNRKIDGVESSLGGKIDAVAADLSAHRADTEAHHGVYRVKEG